MSKIKMESQGNIAVLTLNNGTTNAINPDVVNNLHKKFNEIKNEAEGIVLCGGGKFFSIGMDLPLLINLNRSAMSDFWYKFKKIFKGLILEKIDN